MKMIKSAYDEALDIVNEALEQPDNSVIFKHTGLNELKKVIEQAKKQEKLLALYKELLELNKKHTTFKVKRQLDIEKLIKGLENDR